VSRAPRLPRRLPRTPGAGATIVGIDVETACPEHGAVCAIGVAVVRGGEVRAERHWLLDPRTRFDPRFIAIHGIRPEDVRGQPALREIWPALERFVADAAANPRAPGLFDGLTVEGAASDARRSDSRRESRAAEPPPIDALHVAHNAAFDRRQIEAALGRPLPFPVACTVAMSRRAFPRLERHNLAVVSRHLGIALRHHDALSDARASALIAHHALRAGTAP
jgi:DNA polymerase-3 subunit epsilon